MSYDYAAIATYVATRVKADSSICMRSICEEQQIDRHTVNRALIAVLGVRFNQLKAQAKAERIRRILTDGQVKPISQAAAEAGYASASALGKHTRKVLGITPSAIRRQG